MDRISWGKFGLKKNSQTLLLRICAKSSLCQITNDHLGSDSLRITLLINDDRHASTFPVSGSCHVSEIRIFSLIAQGRWHTSETASCEVEFVQRRLYFSIRNPQA